MICVVYVGNFLVWGHLQYDIDKVMKSFKDYGTSYNWEHSKGKSVSELLCIAIKTLDNGGLNFYQNGVI